MCMCKLFIRADEPRESKQSLWMVAVVIVGGEGRVRNRPLNQHRKYRATAAEVLFIIEQTTAPPSHLTLLFLLSTAVRFWTARRLFLTGCVMMMQYRSITETNPETTVRELDDPGRNRFESL